LCNSNRDGYRNSQQRHHRVAWFPDEPSEDVDAAHGQLIEAGKQLALDSIRIRIAGRFAGGVLVALTGLSFVSTATMNYMVSPEKVP